jgi:hypothetical protein
MSELPDTAASLAAKERIEEAQAEYEAIMAQAIHRRDSIKFTKDELQRVGDRIYNLDFDFDTIERNAKANIHRLFGTYILSPHERSVIDGAFVDLQRLPFLRELVPGILAEVKAKQAQLQSDLEELEAEEAADRIFGGAP